MSYNAAAARVSGELPDVRQDYLDMLGMVERLHRLLLDAGGAVC